MRFEDDKVVEDSNSSPASADVKISPFDPVKKSGLNIMAPGDLKKILKPTGIITFTNVADETQKIDFLARKVDPLTTGSMHDTMIIRSLVRMKELYELQEKDFESMSPEQLADLFDVDKKIEDNHNNNVYLCVTASYALLEPAISPTDIIHTLPMSWIKVIADWAAGGVNEFPDLVDGFRVSITSPV